MNARAIANLSLAAGLAGALLLAWAATAAERADARARCAGKKATIVRGGGDNVIKAPKHGKQVVVSGAGDDVIFVKRNKDRVCSGPGNDTVIAGNGRDKVFSGPGNDYIDGGDGRDTVFGGADNDTFVGGGGGENGHGGPGNDRLFGEIQDDNLFGDAGNDLIVGHQGIDNMHGGPGADWIRGDENADIYAGDSGSDTASFATATPPGGYDYGGVVVNLYNRAIGDGGTDKMRSMENATGSAFDDSLRGRGFGTGRGIAGIDQCSGFSVESCSSNPRAVGAVAFLQDAGGLDPGLVVAGGSGADRWSIRNSSSGSVITSSTPLAAGPGCTSAGFRVVCQRTSRPLGYLVGAGLGGADRITVGGFPRTAVVKLDGGPGNDVLSGSSGPDLLYPGESGRDRLSGNGGDDQLVARGTDADILIAGTGADQLSADDPCGGHVFDGGRGTDVAGFGHVTRGGVYAKLGGVARSTKGSCKSSKIFKNNEVLEGGFNADVLIGNNRVNLILGHGGADKLYGRGRHDGLRGHGGPDLLVGGGAKDSCEGGPGKDRKRSC